MRLLKKSKEPIQTVDYPSELMEPVSDDALEELPDEENCFEEEATPVISHSLKRKFPQASSNQEDDATDDGEDKPAVTGRPLHSKMRLTVAQKPQTPPVRSSSQQRARLSADIDPDLRERAKIFTIRQKKPFYLILEDWIREHCPEP